MIKPCPDMPDEIQRYALEMDGEMEPDPCGDWVRYDDLAPTSQWLDISSAPKDGTIFLAWDVESVRLVFWRDNSAYPKLSGFRDIHIPNIVIPLTHWQPIPSCPPTKDLADAGKEKL